MKLYLTTFLQFPIDQSDCIIGSTTLQDWSPYTVGLFGTTITFKFGSIPQVNKTRAYSLKLALPPSPKVITPSSRVWFANQSLSTREELAQIQAAFADTILTKDLDKYMCNFECFL